MSTVNHPGTLEAVADDFKNRGPADRSRINVHEPGELDWWTKKWAVTATQLKIAVLRVGAGAQEVAKHLGKPLPGRKSKKPGPPKDDEPTRL